jgi:hypothetical protein
MRCDCRVRVHDQIRKKYDNGCDNNRRQEKKLRARKSEETNMKKETAHSGERDPVVTKAWKRAKRAARRRTQYTSREPCAHSQATAGSSRASVTTPGSACRYHLAAAELASGPVQSARSHSACCPSGGEGCCSCRREFRCSHSSPIADAGRGSSSGLVRRRVVPLQSPQRSTSALGA